MTYGLGLRHYLRYICPRVDICPRVEATGSIYVTRTKNGITYCNLQVVDMHQMQLKFKSLICRW
jgi:hypothetical protein